MVCATHGVPVGLGSLASAEVAESPGSVAEHAELAAVAKQVQQRLQGTTAEDIVAAVRAVTGNVTEGPDGLLPDIGLRAGEELDEDGDGAGLNDDLGLGGRTRGNVGQGPGSLELDQGVRGSQELDESGDDASLDNLLDRGVSLLGEKLSELGGGLDLEIDLFREDTGDHLREVLVQLVPRSQHRSSWRS